MQKSLKLQTMILVQMLLNIQCKCTSIVERKSSWGSKIL